MKTQTDSVTVFTDMEREVTVHFEYHTEIHPEYAEMSRKEIQKEFDLDEDSVPEITKVYVTTDITGLDWAVVKETIMEHLDIDDENDITID